MVNGLFTVLIALTAAYILSEVFRRFSLPRVLGQILAGIILGMPLIKQQLFDEQVISAFSLITNIGIILLFFFIGLEINITQFKKNFKESSLIAVFNTLIPLAAGFLIGKYLFGYDTLASLIIGIAVSVSSQSISLDILEEVKLLKSKIGNLIIASGTVDDVFELLLISTLLIIFHAAGSAGADFFSLSSNLMVFLLIVIVARAVFIPFALNIFQKEKSQAVLFNGALIIVLIMAYLSELFGVSSMIGALIAGMLVRQTLLTGTDRKPWRRNEISHSIHIISFGFLVPLFFVTVGLNTNLDSISSNLFLIGVLILVDVLGTLSGTIIGVLLSKGSWKEGLIVGFGVMPKGDTELVIATLALNSGFITKDLFTAIIAVAIFSTFLAPIVFRYLVRKYPDNKSIRHSS
ncbi:cation:proton antiporter [Candidatus Woesearchaeota archaeon]|nr:cation:proton antiporter [Candidatus Woesearchaeota archaeon]MBI2660842.1 cation:proton antiporter [Candidatus Woesearchaeota archaeon]